MYELGVVASTPVQVEGKLFRKQIAKFGTYRHPNPKLWDNPDVRWKFTPEYAQQVVANFNNKEILDKVALLDSHDEENAPVVGRIDKLIITDEGLDGVFEVDDPAVLRAGVSVGIDPQYPNSDASKPNTFVEGPVLRHVARTPVPWINGMDDWKEYEEKVAASTLLHLSNKKEQITVLVPEEDEIDMDELRKQVKVLAGTMKKPESEVASMLGIKDWKDEDPKVSPEVQAMIDAINAALKPASTEPKKGEETKELDQEAIMAAVTAKVGEVTKPLTEMLTNLSTAVSTAQKSAADAAKSQLEKDANGAVDTLIKAGKVTAAQKKSMVALYMSNPDTFGDIASGLPVQVEFKNDEEDFAGVVEGDGVARVEGKNVANEIDRLSKIMASNRGVAGKADKISMGEK